MKTESEFASYVQRNADIKAAFQRPGVLQHIKQEITVRELNGTLVTPNLPSREMWQEMLAKYAPGCGSPTHVSGTNGGKMPCGGWLTQLDKTRTQYFCPHCEEAIKQPIHA